MNNLPKFSVAMSVYGKDNPAFFREALQSLYNQTVKPNQIYLVVDGTISDNLENVINDFLPKFDDFTIKRLPTNRGLGNALKIAVSESKYDLVARMDSDDISVPTRFETLLSEYIKDPVDVLGSFTLGFENNLFNGKYSLSTRPLTHDGIVKTLSKKSPMSHVSVLFDRNSVLSVGNYIELKGHEDYYLWARMIQAGYKFKNIDKFLVLVRLGKNQAKRHGGKEYFKAEKELRKYMLENKLITKREYTKVLFVRFIYQILLIPSLRNFLSKHFKRKSISKKDALIILKENRVI